MSDCDAILSQGIRDKYAFSSYDDIKSFIRQALSWDYQTFQQKRSASGGGGGFEIFDLLGISGSGQDEESTFNSLKQSFRSDEQAFFARTAMLDVYREVTNESVVNAWQKCVDGRSGISGYYVGDPSDEYTLILRYKADQPSDLPAQVADVTFRHSERIGNGISRGTIIEKDTTVQQGFRRTDRSRPESLIVTFSNRSEDIEITLRDEPSAKERENEARLTAIEDNVRNLQKSFSSLFAGGGDRGFLTLGDCLLCFGSVALTPSPSNTHTYEFVCTFAREFATPPSIAHAIDAEGSGYTYGVYKNKLTTTTYSGSLTEVTGRVPRPVVSMTYIAIGRPK